MGRGGPSLRGARPDRRACPEVWRVPSRARRSRPPGPRPPAPGLHPAGLHPTELNSSRLGGAPGPRSTAGHREPTSFCPSLAGSGCHPQNWGPRSVPHCCPLRYGRIGFWPVPSADSWGGSTCPSSSRSVPSAPAPGSSRSGSFQSHEGCLGNVFPHAGPL